MKPEIKTRPILMNGAMARATLAGAKSQTRRIVNPQPSNDHSWLGWCASSTHRADEGKAVWSVGNGARLQNPHRVLCPYGQPGDRLWVRETWCEDPEDDGTWAYVQYMGCKGSPLSDIPAKFKKPEHCIYRADWNGVDLVWRPSIHMPRWASRIILEITGVRVERLHDISDADIIAEGIDMDALAEAQDRYDVIAKDGNASGRPTLRSAWRDLWESTGGDWDANPWLWVISFKRVTP